MKLSNKYWQLFILESFTSCCRLLSIQMSFSCPSNICPPKTNRSLCPVHIALKYPYFFPPMLLTAVWKTFQRSPEKFPSFFLQNPSQLVHVTIYNHLGRMLMLRLFHIVSIQRSWVLHNINHQQVIPKVRCINGEKLGPVPSPVWSTISRVLSEDLSATSTVTSEKVINKPQTEQNACT